MLVPPRNGQPVDQQDLAPVRAAAIAAVEPAEPAPTTQTSTSAMTGQVADAHRRSARSGATDITDQPPSIVSSCPVTARDSSDRK